MMKFAAEAAKYLPQVEIIEKHHDNMPMRPRARRFKPPRKSLRLRKYQGQK
jgi:hypothetical protein